MLPSLVGVGVGQLIEPITSFGRSYRATPDEDEFACEYDGAPEPGDLVAPGSATQFKYVNFLDALHRD